MIRTTGRTLLFFFLLLPSAAQALGLGNMEVSSRLNEPVVGRIPLRGLQSGDVEGLSVRLGTPEQFERAGLARPFVLTYLRFEAEGAGADGVIRVTTREPVNEPFLNFLVEVDWPRGRVIREYTVLLDPPVYGAAITSTARSTVATVPDAPDMAAAPAAAQTAPRSPATPSPAVAAAPSAAAPSMAGGGPSSYGPVAANDTLWAVAENTRPDDSISIQRMMLAILAANPGAFNEQNINGLRAGSVLRIPDRAEIGSDAKAEALAEVRRQHAVWREFRERTLGQPAAPAPTGAPAVGGAPQPAAEAPATAESDASRLKVLGTGSAASPGAAPGEQADVEAIRDELHLALEQADATRREADDLKSKLSEADGLIADLQRLVELKDDNIAALQARLAQAETEIAAMPAAPEATAQPEPAPMPAAPEPAAPEPVAPEPVAPEPMAEPTAPTEPTTAEPPPATAPEPAAEPEPPKKKFTPLPPPPPPRTFLDEMRDVLPVDPILLAGGLGVLLIGGGGFAIWRRRKAAAAGGDDALEFDDEETRGSLIDEYAATQLPDAPDADSTELPGEPEDDGEKTQFAPPAGGEAEDDPLAEVNVYLAYERFDQAEELVRGAIEKYPDRHDYHIKLLEVFYAAKDLPSFQQASRVLRDQAGEDSPLIEKAAAWWDDLAPGRGLFDQLSESSPPADSAASEDDLFDVTSGSEGDETGVDFDLGDMGGEQPAEAGDSGLDFDLGFGDTADGTGSGVEFDLDGEDEPAPAGASDEGPEDTEELDFDLGDMGGAAEVEPPAEGPEDTEELDFDLGDMGGDAVSGEAPAAADADDDLDFDLGDTADRSGAAAPADDSADLDFDLGDSPAETGAAAVAGPEDTEELDFDLSAAMREAESAPAAAEGPEETEELDFDLGDAIGGAESEPVTAEGPEDTEELDFDLSAGSKPEPAASDEGDDGLDLDFSGFGDEEAEESSPATAEEGEPALDFDLGSDTPEEPTTAAVDDDSEDFGLDLDLGSAGDAVDAADAETMLADPGDGAQPGASDDDLDLDLGFSGEPAGTDAASSAPGATPESIGTVQLRPDQIPKLGSEGEGEGDDELDFDLGDADPAGSDESSSMDSDFESLFDDADSASADGDAAAALGFDDGALPEISLDDDPGETQTMLRDVGGDDSAGSVDDDDDEEKTLLLDRSGGVDETQTKLDLAEAYIEMGDVEGARGILGEVLAVGDDAQQTHAKRLLANLA